MREPLLGTADHGGLESFADEDDGGRKIELLVCLVAAGRGIPRRIDVADAGTRINAVLVLG